MNYKDLYKSNDDFKAYVDKYKNNFGISVDEALEHLIVKIVAEKYADDLRMVDDGK